MIKNILDSSVCISPLNNIRIYGFEEISVISSYKPNSCFIFYIRPSLVKGFVLGHKVFIVRISWLTFWRFCRILINSLNRWITFRNLWRSKKIFLIILQDAFKVILRSPRFEKEDSFILLFRFIYNFILYFWSADSWFNSFWKPVIVIESILNSKCYFFWKIRLCFISNRIAY